MPAPHAPQPLPAQDLRHARALRRPPEAACPPAQTPAEKARRAEVSALLLATGKRVTPSRSCVLELLLDPSRPADYLTPESIYLVLNDRGHAVSLPTVYRVLGDLERSGLVERHHRGRDGGKIFSAKVHHRRFGHFVCTRCARTQDISEPALARQLQALADARGLAVSAMSISLQGVCSACSSPPA